MNDPAATELWLIRHGESLGNRAGMFQGQEDSPLSPVGRAQIAYLAERLRHGVFDALYCSDLARAQVTADAISAATMLAPNVDARLREVDVGSWAGLTADEVRERFPDEWAQWSRHFDPRMRRGGGESYADVQERIVAAIDGIAARHPGGQVLVVFHGLALRTYLARLLDIDLRRMWHLVIDNAGISRVKPFALGSRTAQRHAGQVICVNDTAHLEGLHLVRTPRP